MAIIFGHLVNDFNGLGSITQRQLHKIINRNAYGKGLFLLLIWLGTNASRLWFVWLFIAKTVVCLAFLSPYTYLVSCKLKSIFLI